jgi:hypothetical protein
MHASCACLVARLETCAHIQESLREGAFIELTDEDGKTPKVFSVDCVPLRSGVCA